jgi:hypothetical protein
MNSWKSTLAALLLGSGILVFSPKAHATGITGGTTTVSLNTGTLTTLVGLGFSITPIAPSTLTGTNAVFPITGGDTTSLISHSGGLNFTRLGVSASISNFVINVATNRLTGNLTTGGSTTPNVTFFDIGAGGALTMDAVLGAGLASVFGVPNLTGAPIGTAAIAPTLVPEPATATCMALAVALGALYLMRRRSRAES